MGAYFQSLWGCRYFWWALVRNDLRARYRRSVVGLGWSLLRPLATTVILCTVLQRIFHRSDWWSYAPELLTGLVCWDYLVVTTKQGCSCFFHAESYIRQHPAPLAIYPLRVALGESVHFLLALSVVIGLVWSLHGFGNLAALVALFPVLVLLFLFAWCMAILFGFLNVYYQDVQHLCDVGFNFLFYMTPIIYRAEDLGGGRLTWMVKNLNPLVPFLRMIRMAILEGSFPSMSDYTSGLLVVLVFGTLAYVLSIRMQKHLVFAL